MQSHWMINHTTYQAVQESVPKIIKYKASDGVDSMDKTPVHDVIKKIHPDIYRVPLFRRKFCTLLMKEISYMQKEIGFETNSDKSLRSFCVNTHQSSIAVCGLWYRQF